MRLYIITGNDSVLENNISVYNNQVIWEVKHYVYTQVIFSSVSNSEFMRGRLHGGSPREKTASVSTKTILCVVH